MANENEEFEIRINILERQINSQLKKSTTLAMPIEAKKKPRSSFLVPQNANIDNINKKIDNLEAFVDTLNSNFKKIDSDLKEKIIELYSNKAEKEKVDANIADTSSLQEKFLELDKLVQHNQDSIMKRLGDVQKNHLPHFYKKIAIHDEAVALNQACIKNLEKEGDTISKKMKILENQEIDFSSVEKVNLRIGELTEAVKISRSDLT